MEEEKQLKGTKHVGVRDSETLLSPPKLNKIINFESHNLASGAKASKVHDFAKNNLGRFAPFWPHRAQKKAPLAKNSDFWQNFQGEWVKEAGEKKSKISHKPTSCGFMANSSRVV